MDRRPGGVGYSFEPNRVGDGCERRRVVGVPIDSRAEPTALRLGSACIAQGRQGSDTDAENITEKIECQES